MNNTMLYSISSFGAGTPTASSAKKKARKSLRRMRAASSGRRSKLVQGRVKKLQRLIPGGRGLPADRLFSRTADYILHLRLQVHVLQALSKIYNSST